MIRWVLQASGRGVVALGVALMTGCSAGNDVEPTAVTSEAVTLGANLIVNGDAESGPGITNSNGTVTIPAWTVTGGTPVAIEYGASGGFPTASTPGPANRGVNFFGGGNGASASLTQNIDVSGNATQIDAAAVHYDLNGWLGGWSNQNDQCDLQVTFLDSKSKSLGSATIGPVTVANRGNTTEFLQRDASGTVPTGTRTLEVVLAFTRYAGTFDDGYADDLSLVLTATGTDGGADTGASDAAIDHWAGDASGVDAGKDASGGTDASADAGTSDATVDSGGGATGDGGTCSTPIPSDPYASERASCSFTTGATATSTLPISGPQQAAIPIKNVIVMMKENRSFDHLLGQLHSLVPAVEAIPSNFTNPGASGGTVSPFHQTSTCISHDPDHQWAAMHTQVDNGAMDGFVTSAASSTGTDGTFAMSYYAQSDLPFYYWLASTYPVNDRHFASTRSGTFPDRNFLLLGTADGVQSTGDGYPLSTTATIFESLTNAGITWGVYSDGSLLSGTLDWSSSHAGVGSFETFLSLLDAGTLPQVAFVDGIDNVTDDHPTANVQEGEAWSRQLYEHSTASSLWPHMAILWTYDEGGGFFDHVPPPNNWCVARPTDPPVGGNGTPDSDFYELGVRVPMVVISPYARAGYTSHVVQEHTAVTRFIETVFSLPALTNRDANSDALLDMFDFGCPPAFLTPPPAPASGTGGCDGSIVMTTDKPVYAQGESILVSWTGGPGNNNLDWIGIYPYGTLPHSGSTLWEYIGGSHTGSSSPASGTVTINSSSQGVGPWPLSSGSWTAWYLLDDGYTGTASIEFTVQ